MTSVIFFAGSFKPPHKGHFEILKQTFKQEDTRGACLFISKKSRDSVNINQALAIWEIYAPYLRREIVIIPVDNPVTALYQSMDNAVEEFQPDDPFLKERKVTIIGGENDIKRFKHLKKEDKIPMSYILIDEKKKE